jgi:hypothetical protein
MLKRNNSIVLLCTALTISWSSIVLQAQESQTPQNAEPSQQAQSQPQEKQTKRNLWIAKFTGDTKAASAVASTQAGVNNALKYSNIFDSVQTFEDAPKQPKEVWVLTANETDYGGGNAAARALVGYGAGRAHIEMEYKLSDPSGKVVLVQKVRTKPPWSWGGIGANQDQGMGGQ